MNGKSCFFIGHRETPDNVLPLLQETVNRHIECYGVTEFIVGHYGNFDYLAAKAVITAKQQHPKIILSLLIPYHPAERPIKKPKGFDNTYYPPGMEDVPRKLAIVRANRYMVDHVDFPIAYTWHPASNARELVEYAEKKSEKGAITVTNIAQQYRNHLCLDNT